MGHWGVRLKGAAGVAAEASSQKRGGLCRKYEVRRFRDSHFLLPGFEKIAIFTLFAPRIDALLTFTLFAPRIDANADIAVFPLDFLQELA